MPDVNELERFDLNMLAMYCLRVADSPETDPWQAAQARQLKAHWAQFIGDTKPPIPGLDSSEAIACYGRELKRRMVSFLADCPLRLSLVGDATRTLDVRAKQATVGGRQ